nr:ATP synthase F0 subunit 8 [Uniformus sp.]
MPQMSPMWWTFLMLIFILSFILVNNFLYFNYDSKKSKLASLKNFKMLWVW